MKIKRLIFITVLSIMLLPVLLLGQQVNQGYHLAITPYAELYQKDSLNAHHKSVKKTPVNSKKKLIHQSKPKSIPIFKKCKNGLKKSININIRSFSP